MPNAPLPTRLPRRRCASRTPLYLLAGLALGISLGAGAAEPREIRIGILAPEGVSDVLREWDFVGPTLQAALPGRTVRTEELDEATLRGMVARSEMDFFIANSGFLVEMAAAHGATPLATVDGPTALSPREAQGSAIVVLAARSGLWELHDLKQQRVIAVSDGLFCGSQIGLHTLQRAGVQRSDLRSLRFVGYRLELLLDDLLANRADAAIMRRCLLEKLTSMPQYRRGSFRVLNEQSDDGSGCARSTDLYPDWAFARLKNTDPELTRAVTLALLRMPRSSDGHAWTVPTEYDGVHTVLRDLEIGPYKDLPTRTLADFVYRYRLGFAMVALLLVGALIHVILAERLVKRRTAALRLALEERDRMAADARRREDELMHLSRLGALGEMSSMLAHELAQPLGSIANFAQGIVRRVGAGLNDPIPLADAGAEIARQAERAGAIMQRVRGFAGKRVEARVQVDLIDVIASATALFRSMASDAHLTELAVEEGLTNAPALVDRLQIEQVLINLYKNALDAMAHLPADQRHIEVLLRRMDDHYEIEVRDNGEGIGDTAVQRLFEPFFTTKRNGVGLGLAICKRVIEAHGGNVSVCAAAGSRGLSVMVRLPVLHAAPAGGASIATPHITGELR